MRLRPPTSCAPRSSPPVWVLLAVAAAPAACGPSEPASSRGQVAELTAPIINGSDDRQELSTLTPASDRDAVERSVAALMWMHRIDYAEPSALRAVSLAEGLGVCEDERFAEQPTAAFCSGTLLDDDLLLT